MKLPASLLATMALAACGPMYERRTTPVEVDVETVEVTEPIDPEAVDAPIEVQHFAQPPGATYAPPPPVHVVDDCPGCGMG